MIRHNSHTDLRITPLISYSFIGSAYLQDGSPDHKRVHSNKKGILREVKAKLSFIFVNYSNLIRMYTSATIFYGL